MTGREYVQRAYRRANIITPVDDLNPEELRDGFAMLLEVSDQMKLDSKMIPCARRTVTTLTSGQTSYTIGSGGDVNVPRPQLNDVVGVGVIFDLTASPQLERDISPLLTVRQYQDLTAKGQTISGPPTRCYYDQGFNSSGLGTLYPWPITLLSNVGLALYLNTPFDSFASYSDDITFPPGYTEHLVCQTALRACDEYGTPYPQGLEKRAMKAQARVKRGNFKLSDLRFDKALVTTGGRGYNIYTDS